MSYDPMSSGAGFDLPDRGEAEPVRVVRIADAMTS
jgi:hypothetical protein